MSESPEKKNEKISGAIRMRQQDTLLSSYFYGVHPAPVSAVGARKLPIITELNVITSDVEVTVSGIIFLAQKQ